MIQDKIYKALNRVLTKANLETLTQATIRDIATANNIDLEVDMLSEEIKQKFLDATREHKQNSYQLVDIQSTTVEEENHQLVDTPKNESENIPAHNLTTIQQSDNDTNPKSNALVFVNPFSKALAVRQSVDNSGIQLTDTQVFELATILPDEFSDQTDFSLSLIHI
jgi:hypothetical protein